MSHRSRTRSHPAGPYPTGANRAFRVLRRITGAVSTVGLGILISACDGDRSPIAPGPPPPGAPLATYSLSGVVSEMTPMGLVAVEGVTVQEANSRRQTLTDAAGLYSFAGLSGSSNSVSASKPGYLTQTRTLSISGDTRLDLQVDRIVTNNTLSGVVFEATAGGRVPIEGVEIYCDSCGSPDGHTLVYTDANGAYRLDWTPNGDNPLFVTKAGYEILDPNGTLRDRYGRITATVHGDTRFDIELVRK